MSVELVATSSQAVSALVRELVAHLGEASRPESAALSERSEDHNPNEEEAPGA